MRRGVGGLDGDSLVFVISESEVHVLCEVVRHGESRFWVKDLRRHCVAAPLLRLSMVAHL